VLRLIAVLVPGTRGLAETATELRADKIHPPAALLPADCRLRMIARWRRRRQGRKTNTQTQAPPRTRA
jgi:hypothetical protein